MPDFSKPPWDLIVPILRNDVMPILVIIVITIVLVRGSRLFVHRIVKALMDREVSEGTAQELSAVELKKRMDTLDDLGGRVVRFFVLAIASLMVLQTVHVEIGPAIAGLGIVGVAVGFGAQHLVRDYLNGALILIENQFSRGDIVSVAGVSGTVEDFSLRRTTLRDVDGIVHTVPNGEIRVASNLTRVWARVNLEVSVAYATDIEKAIQVVDTVGRDMASDPAWKRRILEAPKVDRIEALGEYGVTLKIFGTVRAPERWAAPGELRKRLLAAFKAHDIEIPYPHRVVLNRLEAAIAAPAGTAGPTDDDLAPEE